MRLLRYLSPSRSSSLRSTGSLQRHAPFNLREAESVLEKEEEKRAKRRSLDWTMETSDNKRIK